MVILKQFFFGGYNFTFKFCDNPEHKTINKINFVIDNPILSPILGLLNYERKHSMTDMSKYKNVSLTNERNIQQKCLG